MEDLPWVGVHPILYFPYALSLDTSKISPLGKESSDDAVGVFARATPRWAKYNVVLRIWSISTSLGPEHQRTRFRCRMPQRGIACKTIPSRIIGQEQDWDLVLVFSMQKTGNIYN